MSSTFANKCLKNANKFFYSKLLNGQKFFYQFHALVHLPDVGKFGHAVVVKGSGPEIRARQSPAGQRRAVRSSADQVRDRIDALFTDRSFGLFNKMHMREYKFFHIMIAV